MKIEMSAKKALCAVLALAQAAALFAAPAAVGKDDGAAVERYALYVASNDGGKKRETLKYAGRDASRVALAMREIGGVRDEDSIMLLDPTKDKVESAFSRIKDMIKGDANHPKRREFFFYYSGHSDENALLLGSDRYGYKELKSDIDNLPADVHVVMLDSCYSGGFVREKGGVREKPFLLDDSAVVKGHAYLSSSSDREASQESDAIQSSYFTQALVSGLRGGADASGDGKVSLNELYHYAFNQTLAETESSQAGPQHPSYNITLVGSGDLVLTDLSDAEATLTIPSAAEGSFFIRDKNGALISQIDKVKGAEIALALPAGDYSITLVTVSATSQGTIHLDKGDRARLNENILAAITKAPGRSRGDAETAPAAGVAPAAPVADAAPVATPDPDEPDAAAVLEKARAARAADDEQAEKPIAPETTSAAKPRAPELIKISLIPGISFPFTPASNVLFSLGLFMSSDQRVGAIQLNTFGGSITEELNGLQLSGFYNTVNGKARGVQGATFMNIAHVSEMLGAQAAGFMNIKSGKMLGAQAAGFMNVSNDAIDGIQVAGFMNTSSGHINGLQAAGFMNQCAGGLSGAQLAGFMNVSGQKVTWLQAAGIMNIANEVDGVQIGVINIAKKNNGLALGVLNFIDDGLMDTAVYADSCRDVYVQYQGGTKKFFTTFLVGTNWDLDFTGMIYGIGLGTRFELSRSLSLDLEAIDRKVIYFDQPQSYSAISVLPSTQTFAYERPSLRLTANIFVARHLGVFASAEGLVRVSGYNDLAFQNYPGMSGEAIPGTSVTVYPVFSAGIKF
jgi:hypothetical protein